MTIIEQLEQNHMLVAAIISWALAQFIKIIIDIIRIKKFDWRLIFATGGMPSSHSSFVMALATTVGLEEGFNTTLFAIAAAFAIVVMYDAQGVRQEAGKQARIINLMIANIENSGVKLDKNLKELLGHTPLEVTGGAILGLVVGILMS